MFGTDNNMCASRAWLVVETSLGAGLAAAGFTAAAAFSGSAALGPAALIGAVSVVAWGALAYIFELGGRQLGLESHTIQVIQLLGVTLCVSLGGSAAITLGLLTSNALLLALALMVSGAMVLAIGYLVVTGRCCCPLPNCFQICSGQESENQ